MTFKDDFKKSTDLIIKATEKTVRGGALKIFGLIVKRTPVGNPSIWKNPENKPKQYVGGRLRNNWQATINKPANGVRLKPSKSGSDSTRSIVNVTKKYKINEIMFLTNNLPYAARVEFKGHSTQAKNGMVRETVKLFQAEIDRLARKNKV